MAKRKDYETLRLDTSRQKRGLDMSLRFEALRTRGERIIRRDIIGDGGDFSGKDHIFAYTSHRC